MSRCTGCSRRRWRQWRKRGTRKRQADQKTAGQEKAERDTKEEDGNPSYSVGQKDRPTQARWTTVPGTMFKSRPEVSSYRQDSRTFEGSEGLKIQTGWQNRDHGLDGRTSHRLSQCQNGRTAGASPEVPSRNDGFKGNLTLPKVHRISHQKASVPEVSQGDRSRSSTGNVVPILGAASTPGGCQSIPRGIV